MLFFLLIYVPPAIISDNTDHILQQIAVMNIHGLANGMDTVPPTDL